jgi:hypothetical protein
MPRYIDDAKPMAAGKIKVGETEFNGNTANFFLLEPVGLDSGERPDQTGLAMVDVPAVPRMISRIELVGWADGLNLLKTGS